MKTVALIPARAGSKGLPDKNIMEFCGQPLFAWSIMQCKRDLPQTPVYLSSDSREYLERGKFFGAVPLLRPAVHAEDDTPMKCVIWHFIKSVALDDDDVIILLQPTSPLRIKRCISDALWGVEVAGSVVSVVPTGHIHEWTKGGPKFTERHLRQKKNTYIENGSIYAFKVKRFLETLSPTPVGSGLAVMPDWTRHEIDDEDDFAVCELLFRRHKLDAD